MIKQDVKSRCLIFLHDFLPVSSEINPDLIQFTSPPTGSKTGQCLFKNNLPQIELVYDPNKLCPRL